MKEKSITLTPLTPLVSYAMSGDSDYTDDWYWLLKDNEAP